jgi:hypothetical protein
MMAQGIVNLLKPVDIEKSDGDSMTAGRCRTESLLEAQKQQLPVGQAGQGVMLRLKGELGPPTGAGRWRYRCSSPSSR